MEHATKALSQPPRKAVEHARQRRCLYLHGSPHLLLLLHLAFELGRQHVREEVERDWWRRYRKKSHQSLAGRRRHRKERRCFSPLGSGRARLAAAAPRCKTLPLHCASTGFRDLYTAFCPVLPLPFFFKTVPLPCASTAFRDLDTAFTLCFRCRPSLRHRLCLVSPLPSQLLRHRLCLVSPLPSQLLRHRLCLVSPLPSQLLRQCLAVVLTPGSSSSKAGTRMKNENGTIRRRSVTWRATAAGHGKAVVKGTEEVRKCQ